MTNTERAMSRNTAEEKRAARYLRIAGAINVRRDTEAQLRAALDPLGDRVDFDAYRARTNILCELTRRGLYEE